MAQKYWHIFKKNHKYPISASTNKCLWISGLAPTTKATELKVYNFNFFFSNLKNFKFWKFQAMFSTVGRVPTAKIVSTTPKNPDEHKLCFGFVMMGTPGEAQEAVRKFGHSSLNGLPIKVDLVREWCDRVIWLNDLIVILLNWLIRLIW